MVRKLGIIFLIIFTLGLVATGYILLKNKRVEVTEPFRAIPADAAIIIETPDVPDLISRIAENRGLVSRLSVMEWAKRILKDANIIDSLTGKRTVREFMEGKKAVISFHPVTAGKLVPLAVMSTGPVISRYRFTSLVSQTGAKLSQVKESGGVKIYKAVYGSSMNKDDIYLATVQGIVIVSPSELLVENALNNRNNGTDIRQQQGFSQLSGAFGGEHDNIYILFRNLPRFFNGIINNPGINVLSGVAVAAGGEIDEKEGGLFINGYLATSGAGSGADRIKDLAPLTPGAEEVLPATTRSYTTVMRETLLSGEPANDPASVNATDIALSLKPFIENEFTLANAGTTTGNNDIALFRVSNRSQAEELLLSKITGKFRSMGLGKSNFMAVTKDKNGEEINIYRMPFTGVASMLAQGQKLPFDDSWALFCRSYLIFAQTPEVLVDILNSVFQEKTLINDPYYREVEKSLPTKSSFLFYATAGAMTEKTEKLLTPEALKKMKPGALSGIGAIGVSLTPSNGMIYTSISVAFPDENILPVMHSEDRSADTVADVAGKPDATLLWQTQIGATSVIKPFIFINHNNNSKEIFVQDASDNIYLLNSSGKILWKTKINERIRGDVCMIDYYGNGKNQLLFAGKNYLHLIDRNGSYVGRFPVKLRSPASNTLAVMDYESNRDYRLFIAGEDKKIYAYDKLGNQVKGWEKFVTQEKITSPVRYFRAEGKDYIVASDSRNIYLLDRRGGKRVTFNHSVAPSPNTCIRLTKRFKLVFAGTDGLIHFISFTGKDETRKAGDFSSEAFFDYSDIDMDGTPEYIFYDKGTLSVFREDLSALFTVRLVTTEYPDPEVISSDPGNRFISVTDYSGGRVSVINSRGNNIAGFPAEGSVPPVETRISATSGYVFITGGPGNSISCYKVAK